MTQIEWLEVCATELAADGIVLDERHFPRTDSDYLAQIKKMASDLGLSVAAFAIPDFFSLEEPAMERRMAQAIALGAPLLASQLPRETETSWSEALEGLGRATSLAKHFNVTLALRNVPNTFAAGSHDMKRVSKEADSSWLRYAPDFGALDVGSEPAALMEKAVLIWHAVGAARSNATAALPALAHFRGFLAIDDASGAMTLEDMQNALQLFRSASDFVVNRT